MPLLTINRSRQEWDDDLEQPDLTANDAELPPGVDDVPPARTCAREGAAHSHAITAHSQAITAHSHGSFTRHPRREGKVLVRASPPGPLARARALERPERFESERFG